MALSPDWLQEYFEQAQKCKISWKIEKIEIWNKNQCLVNMRIFIKWENNKTHFMNATLLHKECSFDSYYKPFFEGDIKVWNQVEYILDEENYHTFDYNTSIINTENIPYCTENKIEIPENIFSTNYYFLWFFIFIIIMWALFIKFYKKK